MGIARNIGILGNISFKIHETLLGLKLSTRKLKLLLFDHHSPPFPVVDWESFFCIITQLVYRLYQCKGGQVDLEVNLKHCENRKTLPFKHRIG